MLGSVDSTIFAKPLEVMPEVVVNPLTLASPVTCSVVSFGFLETKNLVVVGIPPDTTNAKYYLKNVKEVEQFFRWLSEILSR